jgi:hypothetical protein
MIGVTISADAYAAIAAALHSGAAAKPELAPGRECRVWLPRAIVERLRALREPGETFSDVILRLTERGASAALTR